MNEFNNWHPMPRYGLAASLVYLDQEPRKGIEAEDLQTIAISTLAEELNHFMLSPYPSTEPDTVFYKYISSDKLNPGSKTGQAAANGYYVGPHVLTSNNASDILKEVKALLSFLSKGIFKSYELKRSFAPMVAKLNAGKTSMSNPRVGLIQAAFTAIGAITYIKPAAYMNNGNTGILPDLPFYDPDTRDFPLYDFIKLFSEIQSEGLGESAYTRKLDRGEYKRPKVFLSNYPDAPRSSSLGTVPLIAAIGKWVNKHNILYDQALSSLNWLENRPIYLVSYNGTQQESFGHHLVGLAISGELHKIVNSLSRVSLIGVEDGKKFDDNKWKLFVRFFDQFLRFFNPSSLHNFLAYRATYPSEFLILLKSYFMQTGKYPEELIEGAVAYGRSLNRAAYNAAKQEDAEDQSKGRESQGVKKYKHRVLLQLESIIQSAKSGSELAARLNAQVGRLTMQDIDSAAQPFLIAVINDQILLDDAQNLITAFMRLSTFQAGVTTDESSDFLADESVLD